MMKWITELQQLAPLQSNVVACFLMLFYFKVAIELVCLMRIRFKRPYSRHVLHMIFSSLVMFWPLFDISDEWSWRLNVIVPAAMFCRMIYKGGILRDPDDPDVQNLSLSSSPSDLLYGTLQLSGLMVWLGLYQFMQEEAAIIAAASFGDALAPIIGKYL